MERTEEQQERLNRIIEGYPAWRLLQVFQDEVGSKRLAQLIGWAVLWGLTGESSGGAVRRRLEEQGLTERSAYRAAADYKRIGDRILQMGETDQVSSIDVPELLRRLAVVIAA